MNAPEPYERRLDRTLLAPTAEAEKTVDAMAVHRDPSISTAEVKQGPDRSRPTVAWVRPSEMPTLLGSTFVRRGIDLQSELTRRARRSPGAAASTTARRVTRASITRPEPTIPTITNQEGLGL